MKLKIFSLTHPLHMAMGFIIWCVWFTMIYAGLSLGCVAAPAPEALDAHSWLNISLAGFTAIVAALLFLLGMRCWRYEIPADNEQQARFILRVSAAVYICSGIATLAVGIPTLMLPPCL